MFVASKGLEIPWLQGLLPVVPLGFASRGRELKAGCCQEDQAWVEFHRDVWKYAENSCVCTLPGKLGSLLVGLRGKVSNCCGPCRHTRHLGREGPLPQCSQFVLRRSPQFLRARLRVPAFVCGQSCSQHCFILHELIRAERLHWVSQTLIRYMRVWTHFLWQ